MPTKTLYVAHVEHGVNRPAVRAFSERGKAIDWAVGNFLDRPGHQGPPVEEAVEGYEWSASYDRDGDRAYVVAVGLDDASSA